MLLAPHIDGTVKRNHPARGGLSAKADCVANRSHSDRIMNTQVQSSETVTENTTPVAAATPRPHRLQAHSYARRIAQAEAILRRASTQSELADRLAAQGFTPEKIAEGDALRRAAQDAFTRRQLAIGAERQALTRSVTAMEQARRAFGDFRIMARAMFKSSAAHALLNLGDSVPYEIKSFILMAQTTYETALQTPELLDALTLFGYPPERLQNALTALEDAQKAMQQADEARALAVYATRERQDAIKALDAWMSTLRVAIRPATRGRP